MKFTAQNTINREFVTYSQPITKHHAAQLWCRIIEEAGQDFRDRLACKLALMDDQAFLQCFNKTMNIQLRIFAPGMYQIKYNGTHVYN
jgi:hypothetical protein